MKKNKIYRFTIKLAAVLLLGSFQFQAFAIDDKSRNLMATEDMLNSAQDEKPMSLDERIKALEKDMGISVPEESNLELGDLEHQVQQLKTDIIQLNRELVTLEQDILTPINSQAAFFLSLDKGHFFKIDGLKVKVDGAIVEHHLYTQQELEALKKGAIQRVYTSNLAPGKHELTMILSGFSLDGRDIKRAAEYSFYKPNSKKYIELAITDNTETQTVNFEFREWD